MQPIAPCQSYAARPAGRTVYENGPHAFKVYLIDITGRRQPELYEWDRCGRDRDSVVAGLKRAGVEVNRKMLAEIAVNDREAFRRFVELAREGAAAA